MIGNDNDSKNDYTSVRAVQTALAKRNNLKPVGNKEVEILYNESNGNIDNTKGHYFDERKARKKRMKIEFVFASYDHRLLENEFKTERDLVRAKLKKFGVSHKYNDEGYMSFEDGYLAKFTVEVNEQEFKRAHAEDVYKKLRNKQIEKVNAGEIDLIYSKFDLIHKKISETDGNCVLDYFRDIIKPSNSNIKVKITEYNPKKTQSDYLQKLS